MTTSGTPQASAHTRPQTAFRQVAVIGCGLVGGSFAAATQRLEGVDDVVIHDVDPDTRAAAAELGVGTRVATTIAEAVSGADLVLLAVPVPVLAEVAGQLAGHLSPTAIVTDVGSVKSRSVVEVEHRLGPDVRFIGGHPMAGSEHSGIRAADATLFQGATWLLTPTVATHPTTFAQLAAHITALGARVLAVAPDEHDRLVAIASHLPQVLASVLMDYANLSDGAPLRVAAGGFRDVTRVAASDPDLWTGILSDNRDAVVATLDEFDGRLRHLRDAIALGEWAILREVLDGARQARRQLPRRGLVASNVDLIVPIPDRPGAIAVVTGTISDAGVNIEDVSMRHATEGDRGAMVLAVDGLAAAHRAQTALAAKGLPSHVEPR